MSQVRRSLARGHQGDDHIPICIGLEECGQPFHALLLRYCCSLCHANSCSVLHAHSHRVLHSYHVGLRGAHVRSEAWMIERNRLCV